MKRYVLVLCIACGSGSGEPEEPQTNALNTGVESDPNPAIEPAEHTDENAPDPVADEAGMDGAGDQEPERIQGDEPRAHPTPGARRDPIARQVARLDEFGLWTNGLFPSLTLPETASERDVLTEMFSLISFDEGRVTRFEILASRDVAVGSATYRALHLRTNLDEKIVFMQYQSHGWWTRVYAVSRR